MGLLNSQRQESFEREELSTLRTAPALPSLSCRAIDSHVIWRWDTYLWPSTSPQLIMEGLNLAGEAWTAGE